MTSRHRRDVSQALEPDSPVGASSDEAVATRAPGHRRKQDFVHWGRSATQTAAADAEKALLRKRKAEDRGFSVLLVTGASGLGKREGFLGSRACGAAAPVSCRLL